jgi:predicted acylesterase/phospholipase RssA
VSFIINIVPLLPKLNNKTIKYSTMSNVAVPKLQRALVFQGGGSLGAYEAGVFHVLYHWIKKDLNNDDENIFDIIAGTSIGAINASIILSHILERKEEFKGKGIDNNGKSNNIKYWEGSPENLVDFWRYVSSTFDYFRFWTPFLKSSWDNWRSFFPFLNLPSGEAFRRYLSTRRSLAFGEQHVFSPLFFFPFATPMFNKFFDYTPLASWHQYSNDPLRSSIEKFAKKLRNGQKIKTSIEKNNEPRLLLVSVDIENAETTTFDSYKKKDEDKEGGISLKHVIASAAVPKNFPYEEINGHKYWDGGIVSNTPLRELISEHTDFWKEKLGLESEKEKLTYTTWKDWEESEQKIPKVEVCIINLHPSQEAGAHIPSLFDYDTTKDRENDIRFHDKTEYDLKMAKVTSDYKDFVERMTDVAIESIDKINESVGKINDKKYKDDLKEYYNNKIRDFNDILEQTSKSTKRKGGNRYYWHLLKHRFDLDEKIKIQREDDEDIISDKIFDFSYDTIDKLIKKGIDDALDKVFEAEKEKHDNSVDDACNELQKLIEDIKAVNTNEDQYLIGAAENIIKKFQ